MQFIRDEQQLVVCLASLSLMKTYIGFGLTSTITLDNTRAFTLDQRNCVVFYMHEQRVAAAVAFNRGRDVQRVMRLIKSRVQVDTVKLQDENIDLRSLMPGAKQVRTHQHHIVPHAVTSPGEEAK